MISLSLMWLLQECTVHQNRSMGFCPKECAVQQNSWTASDSAPALKAQPMAAQLCKLACVSISFLRDSEVTLHLEHLSCQQVRM